MKEQTVRDLLATVMDEDELKEMERGLKRAGKHMKAEKRKLRSGIKKLQKRLNEKT